MAAHAAPAALESSLPGVFLIGDVRHRSVKRVASAVGGGAVVVDQVHQLLDREVGGAAT
jgi:thioredoxin reductase (NADPH)